MSFLTLSNLHKKFGQSVAVDNTSLDVAKGEFISLLGPSGCGKTTILRMIAGFETPNAGRIHLDGEDITAVPASRRNIGMVFQSYALFPNMTVAGNIGFGLKVSGAAPQEIATRVEELLALVNMSELAGRYPSQLSGGQQQRVSLARALARQPRLLLLDEPLSALDAKIRVSLRDELRQLQRRLGITAIFVTHDQEEALALSDRVVVMNRGRIEQAGTPAQIYDAPETPFVANFVGALNILDATVTNASRGVLKFGKSEIRLDRRLNARGPVKLAIRPEDLEIGPSATSACSLDLVVKDVVFLGPLLRVKGTCEGAELTLDLAGAARSLAPSRSQSITIGFESRRAKLL